MPKKEPLYPHVPKSKKKSNPDTKYVARLDPALATRDVEEKVFESKDEAIAHAESLKVKMLPGDVVHVREGTGFEFNVIYRYQMPSPRGNPVKEHGDIEIERSHGIIVAVGGINTKSPPLPDWALSYIEYPSGQKTQYRDALMKERVNIVQVTDRRIYFEQG